MKKLMKITLVLIITSTSNAELKISVNGVVNDEPIIQIDYFTEHPVDIGVWSNGDTLPLGFFFMGFSTTYYYDIGAALSSFDISNVDVLDGYVDWIDYPEMSDYFEVKNPFVYFFFTQEPTGPGMLVEHIKTTLPGPYTDVAMVVLGYAPSFEDYWYGEILDTKVLWPVPEPMTVLLLGFGGLFLPRRR